MFSFLKRDPCKKLEQEYAAKLEKAMHAQRNGDIRGYSELSLEAEEIYKTIQNLKTSK